MIKDNVEKLLKTIPRQVSVVAAAKTRTGPEIIQAIEAGIGIIGENYVQEARDRINEVGRGAKWHFIGRLQKNKVKKAVELFDMIESVDSVETASELDRRCAEAKRTMEALLEVNSGREEQKSGFLPEEIEAALGKLAGLNNIKIMGLMTMGPGSGQAETEEGFRLTRRLFEDMGKLQIDNIRMKYLSMGMSDSYLLAIGEGANLVRIGTLIFGERGRKL